MRFTQVGAGVALAGVGSALLLPPPVSTSANGDIINTLPFEDNIATEGRVMEVNCPGCPVAIIDTQGQVHHSNVESVLKLNLTVAHNGAADQLLLNDLPIYPVDPRSEAFLTPLTADQLAKNADNTWTYVSTPTLGYSLSVKHPVQSEEQLDLVAIHIEIVEVANKFLEGIPSIELKLLETPSGKLMLGEAETTTPKSTTSEPTDGGQECTTIVCKWRAIIADKLSKLKGCGGKTRPAHVKGSKHHGHHGRPRPHGPHRPFRHHRHRHSLGRFLRNVAVHVLIPILIGIVVGITASLVGMVVGNIVIFVWRLLFRRDRAQYVKVNQVEIVTEESDDGTKAFFEPQGPPPTYTATDEKTME